MTAYDLVVIGAGPAGMSAAFVAGEAGLRVAIVDAAPRMGGQYYRHPPPEFHVDSPHTLHHDWSRFVALREELRRTGAVVHFARPSCLGGRACRRAVHRARRG